MRIPGWVGLAPALLLAFVFFWSAGYGLLPLLDPGIWQALELYSPGAQGFIAVLTYATPGTLLALVLGTTWAWAIYIHTGVRQSLHQSFWVYLVLPPVTVGFFVLLTLDAVWPGLRYTPLGSWGALVLALTLKESIFCGMLILGALLRVDRRLLDCARSLGASSFQAFRTVFLPLIQPAVALAGLLIFLYNLGSWEIPVLLAPTLPKSWPVLIFQAWVDGGTEIARAGKAASGLLILAQIACLFLYFLLIPRKKGGQTKL